MALSLLSIVVTGGRSDCQLETRRGLRRHTLLFGHPLADTLAVSLSYALVPQLLSGTSLRAVEQGCRHVVVGARSPAEAFDRQKDSLEKVRGRVSKVLVANRHKPVRSEALLVPVHGIRNSVGAEQNGVAGSRAKAREECLTA